MANPIKTSDIYLDSGELVKLAKELEIVRKEYEALRKTLVSDAGRMEISIKATTTATVDQREQIEDTSKAADLIAKKYKKYNESLTENAVKLAAISNAQRQANTLNKAEAKLLIEKEGSYNQLSAQYTINKVKLNQMSAEQRKTTESGKELVKTTNAIYQEMKVLQSETGKTALNVGNYKDATDGLLDKLGDMPGALGGAASGVKGLGSQFKKLLANPIVLFIAAIVGGLTLLFNSFKQTEKGSKMVGKAMARLNGLIRGISIVVGDFATATVDAFSSPEELLSKFGNFLKTQIINRFNALLELGGAVALLLKGRFKDAAIQAGNAMIKLNTGLDSTDLENLKDKINDTTEAFAALYDREIAITRANQALARSISGLETEYALASQAAGDATLSLQEQEKAAQLARVALEKLGRAEIQLARNDLSLVNQKLKSATYEEQKALLEEQVSATQALDAAQRSYAVAVAQSETDIRMIRQDELERTLDILIDGADNQKTINERIISDDEQTLSTRANLAIDTQKMLQRSFEAQIAAIEKSTGIQIDANDLVGESDAVLLAQKIKDLGFTDVIAGRALEIVRERRTANQDSLEVERDLIAERKKNGAIDVQLLSGGNKALKEQIALRDKNAVAAVQRTTTTPDAETAPESIYDLLGLDLDSAEQEAISSATNFAIDQIKLLAAAKVEAANQAVEASNREVSAATANLNATIALAEQGYAVNVEAAQGRLTLAETEQDQAFALKRKAEKEQSRLDSLQQASSLITAAAQIFANPAIPFPANLVAVGTMLGSFALAKIRAAKLTKNFGEGDYSVLSGARHNGQGTGIPLGLAADGTTHYAEGGESRAIFSRKAVGKYGSRIADVVKQFNSLTFGEGTQRMGRAAMDSVNVESKVNTGIMEGYLHDISQGGKNKTYRDTKGRLVVQRGNSTTVYN